MPKVELGGGQVLSRQDEQSLNALQISPEIERKNPSATEIVERNVSSIGVFVIGQPDVLDGFYVCVIEHLTWLYGLPLGWFKTSYRSHLVVEAYSDRLIIELAPEDYLGCSQ